MSDGSSIYIFDRKHKSLVQEKVLGDSILRFLYESIWGKMLLEIFVHPFVSRLYGKLQDLPWSRSKIKNFVSEYEIEMDLFAPGSLVNSVDIESSYASFNEFFIRKFLPGKRPFVDGGQMPAFAEARYLGYQQINDDISFPVKGHFLNFKELLENQKLASIFEGGPMLIARLAPVDYHRYHYPDDGSTLESYEIGNKLYSVSPYALRVNNKIFLENERRVTILETDHFGKLAYIEVGATMVGKIVQTHDEKENFKRGMEKGYFLFGGSTVILLGEKGRWKPADDILKNTMQKTETLIRLGDEVANVL